MDAESLVQPNRKLLSFQTAEELQGDLQVPDLPEVSAGYADIYHGIWIGPQGQQVEVAIKELKNLIPRDRQTDAEALIARRDTRMKREVFVWSQTTHPNLHPLLGYRSQPRPRLISPWCRHGNLTHYLRNNPGLSRLDKLRLIFQAACGLEHLHAQSPPICHADIKPENVLVSDYFHAALSDFGLSRVLEGFGRPSGFTTSERIKGTLNYMAGELFTAENPRATLETDVYAFGGLILTVMSGKTPFQGLRESAVLFRITNDQPPHMEDHQGLPHSDPLWGLMRRCWTMTPEARPPMQEVLRELWGAISKEEFDFYSRGLLPSVSGNDGTSSANMNVDAPSEMPAGRMPVILATHPVVEDGLQPSFNIAEGTHYAMSEKAFLEARKTLETLKVDSKITPVIRGYIEAAADVGSSLLELAPTMDRNEGMANSLGFKTLKLVGLLQQLREESIARQGERLAARVADVQRELQCMQENITGWCSSGLFTNAFSCCGQSEGLKECEGMIKKVLEEIRLLVTVNTTDLVTEFESTEMQKEQRRLLDRLGDGNYGVKGNAIEDVTCLPGTRVNILEHIDDWVRSTSGSERVLWIRGMAGRGKSTIASTVAHSWKFRASCAIFHFRRGQDALNARLVCALARQLGSSSVPEVKQAVLESIRENEDIANQQLSEQFKILLVASLGTLKEHLYPILIIVDAIDECHDAKDVVDFVRLIHRHSSSFPTNVRFLLTCRPEAALLRALEPNGWNEVDLDSAPQVSDDLTRFIHHACTQIRNDHGLPESWPSSGDISRLADISQGLFQWARTAITYIGNGSPVDRLRDLLRRQATWSGLDDLYHQILSKAVDNLRQEPEKQQLLRSVLGTLVVAPHPVSLEVIAALYGDSEIFEGMEQYNITHFLRRDVLVDLTSLLHIPTSASEPVRFMHTSIRDLLVCKQRCQADSYHIEAIQYHQQLARLSLGFMLKALRENICNLSDLSQAISEIQHVAERDVSTALRYCCRAWSIHLTGGPGWSESNKDVTKSHMSDFESFSREKVLGWIEVMSVIGATSEAVTLAKQVHHWLLRCSREIFGSLSLANLWNDVHRFIAAFLEPISFGPLHIYASALPHCPRKTELWSLYSSSAKVRILGGHQMSTWPSTLWTRSVNGYWIHVAFSADGSLVISVTDRLECQLWDTETGRQVGETLSGWSDEVDSSTACVSPDGRVLALGALDRTIRLWDTQTGGQLGEPLTGHDRIVLCICFSPDGRVLASGSKDETIRLWDTQTGNQLGEPLTGHDRKVQCVCFSPDGRVLASGSWDNTIRLWDTQTGNQLGEPLTGHDRKVRCVCFSPDGRVLASGSGDKTIRLWDTQTGNQLGEPLAGHDRIVRCICFSPDGRVLASGSEDDTIRLWDTRTGSQLGEPLAGHNRSVDCLCFSPDGRTLASGSWGGTIRLSDTRTGRQLGEPLFSHHVSGFSGCFLGNDRVIASGYNNTTIAPWDPQTRRQLDESLTVHDGLVQCLCLSLDGRVIARGYQDGTIRLWDIHAERGLDQLLTGHDRAVSNIWFSPDDRVIASTSYDRTVRLWDVQTGNQLGQLLTDHYDATCSVKVSFAPDSRVLASGSGDNAVRLWDTRTGRQLGEPLTGHDREVRCVCFSPDGRVLASGSGDKTIRLWDTQTRSQLGEPLTGHDGTVCSVCFAPDSRVLASGSWDKTIRLWDTRTGRQSGEPLTGFSEGRVPLGFSSDGMYIVARDITDHCHTWDTRTHQKLHPPPRIPSDIAIGLHDHWLTHSSYRVFWLPAEFWGIGRGQFSLRSKTLAVARGEFITVFDLSRVV